SATSSTTRTRRFRTYVVLRFDFAGPLALLRFLESLRAGIASGPETAGSLRRLFRLSRGTGSGEIIAAAYGKTRSKPSWGIGSREDINFDAAICFRLPVCA